MIWTLFLSLHALLMVALAIVVIRYRRKNKIPFGTGDDPHLEKRVRIFGNHNEFTPVHLLLLFALETQGAGPHLISAITLLYLWHFGSVRLA